MDIQNLLNLMLDMGISLKGTVFAFDIDSTLAACDEWLSKILKVNFEKFAWGKTGDEVIDKKFEYYQDPDFVRNQPLFADAKPLIDALRQLNATVRFVTAVNYNCAAARYEFLMKELNATTEEIVICADKSKFRADYFLDDNMQNVLSWWKCQMSCNPQDKNPHPVVMRKPWNSTLTGVMSVNNLSDFLYFVFYNEVEKKMANKPAADDVIYVLTAPCGSRKSIIADELCARGFKRPEVFSTKLSPKYTTISQQKFVEMREAGKFTETSVYGGNYYGIEIDSFKPGVKYVLPADMGGAIALKARYRDRVQIVYVKANKMDIIKNIIQKGLSIDETALAIVGVEYEEFNERYAIKSVRSADEL